MIRHHQSAAPAWPKFKATLDTLPDGIDLRDWVYHPALLPVPPTLVNCARVPEILDQGQQGACTGFALAAVANYLLHNQGQTRRVSPHMLYELARRYDEWPGEWYEGSSARGAMKGWLRHGVAQPALWNSARQMTPQVVEDAMNCPGGAYYRVNHRQVRDMHSALAEVGIVYATLMVHEGWNKPGPDKVTVDYHERGKPRSLTLPVIARQGKADAGHAVAIVGYAASGFIVQNSWGANWGAGGFALLPYDDYLQHATDVWVVQLGVPLSVDVWSAPERDASAAGAHALPALTLTNLRPYVIDVGNNGELSASGAYWTTPDDLERLITQDIPAATQGWQRRRVLLYLHGGLNDEKATARRVAALRAPLLANQVYPLHVMWETGFGESLRGYFADWFAHADQLAQRSLLDSLGDGRDWMIERSLAVPLRAIWGEMKENARLASDHPEQRGAMQLLAANLRRTGKNDADWELHVVAHSAGSIFFAWMLRHLVDLKLPLKSVQFLAPAITIELFRETVLAAADAGRCPLPILYLLSADAELDDTVGGQLVYGKSLLHLVANAGERKRGTPLLGLHADLDRDPALRLAYRGVAGDGLPQLIVAGGEREPAGCPRASSQCATHQGFDNDPATMNSVLFRILGQPPRRPLSRSDLNYD